MKYSILYSLLVLLFLSPILTSCSDDDPVIPNEEELITTVTWLLTPVGGGDDVVMSFRDLDGDGGIAPVIVGGTLQADAEYVGSLQLLNETIDPVEDITEEVREEDLDHQFFFESNGLNIQVNYKDEDDNNNPVGLETDIITGLASDGTVTLTLRHEPDKSASGVADGDITNAGGETDIEVTFPVTIE